MSITTIKKLYFSIKSEGQSADPFEPENKLADQIVDDLNKYEAEVQAEADEGLRQEKIAQRLKEVNWNGCLELTSLKQRLLHLKENGGNKNHLLYTQLQKQIAEFQPKAYLNIEQLERDEAKFNVLSNARNLRADTELLEKQKKLAMGFKESPELVALKTRRKNLKDNGANQKSETYRNIVNQISILEQKEKNKALD